MNYNKTNMGGAYTTTHISNKSNMSKPKFIDCYITRPCAFLGIAYGPGEFGILTEEKYKKAFEAGCVVSREEGEKIEGIETAVEPAVQSAKKTRSSKK